VIRQAAGFTGDGNLVQSYNTGRRLIGAAVRGVRFAGIRDEIGTTNSCRGVFLQNAEDCLVERCEFENLSGRALGCDRVGTEWNEGLSFRDNVVDRCGSEWVDIPGGVYQSLESSYGAHEPAVRLDYCRNFEVVCNTIRDGLGDNTQLKNCNFGRLSGNVILNARMGNWFIETCTHIVATDNVVDRAGSRGVTLEETSTHCVFTGNVVSRSGRENLWCNGSSFNTFSGNTFLGGGALRMSGGTAGDFANWNVRISATSGTATNCVDNVLIGNVIDTDGTYAQAGLRVANDAGGTIARNRIIGNAFLGTATPINDQGTQTLLAGNRDTTANGGWIVGASGAHDTTAFTPFEARGVGALLGFAAQIAGGTTATNSPQFKCSRDRGTALGGPANVSAGDRLMAVLAGGYNSAASPLYYNTAALVANAKGVHSTFNSGVMRLEVGQSASAARVAGARVDELGLYARTLTAAPADGDLENNETVLYMNSTTPTLKRKDSGGTVTTIALT
jgi:hypothetical protein